MNTINSLANERQSSEGLVSQLVSDVDIIILGQYHVGIAASSCVIISNSASSKGGDHGGAGNGRGRMVGTSIKRYGCCRIRLSEEA